MNGLGAGWSSGLVEAIAQRLLEASLWGGALAVGVWALCALVPELPAAWRRWLWWAVALKLLLGLAPLPPLALPVLAAPAPDALGEAGGAPATAARSGVTGVSLARPDVPPPDAALAAAPRHAPVSVPASAQASLAPRLLSTLVGAWALGAVLALLAAAGEALRAARLVRRSSEPAEPALRARFARLADELGTPRARLRLSTEVETPQLTGILRPTVLMPARAASTLAEPELEMAIAHELLHVRQHDLLLGLVPALAARLFFFHPLARLAAREHALAREAVCDAAVVGRFAPSPREYGRLLLRLSLPGRAPLRAAVAAAAHHTLHRRLHMLLHPPRRTRALWAWLAGAVALALLIPIRLTASESPGESPRAAEPAVVAAAHSTPAAQPAALLERSGEDVLEQAEREREAGERRDEAERDDEEWEDWNEGRAFLLTYGEGHILSGSRRDHERAARWRRGDEQVLWFRRDDREWVIRDPAILARATALWEPQHALGEQQAALGERQAELGTEQAELGRRQAALGAEQAELAAQQAALGADLAELAAREAALAARDFRATAEERRQLQEQRRRLAEERRPLEDRVEELGDAMGELGRRQGELGRAQGELGRRQGELGAQQGEIGREQGRLSRIAERELWQVLDAAVASGAAERVR